MAGQASVTSHGFAADSMEDGASSPDTRRLCERREQVPGRVGRPVDQEQGGVVLEPSALVSENGGREPAQRLGCGQAGELGALGEVDEAVLAEELALGVTGLRD